MEGKRLAGLTVLGWYFIIGSAISLLSTLNSPTSAAFTHALNSSVNSAIVKYGLLIKIFSIANSVLGIVTGINLLRRKEIWRIVAMFCLGLTALVLLPSVLMSFQVFPYASIIPLGMIIFNLCLIAYLQKPFVKEQFE